MDMKEAADISTVELHVPDHVLLANWGCAHVSMFYTRNAHTHVRLFSSQIDCNFNYCSIMENDTFFLVDSQYLD